MRTVRRSTPANQRPAAQASRQLTIPLDDGTAMLAMIQELIPLGLKAVSGALTQEVAALAGPRYVRGDAHPPVVRWGAQRGSIYLADQKLPIDVPRVRDRAVGREVLGLVQTASENKRVCAAFLRELEERGFRAPAGLLVILDGAKGLRAAVRDVAGDIPVQRCQWHKRENVVSYLPQHEQVAWRRTLHAAYATRATALGGHPKPATDRHLKTGHRG